MGNQLGASEVSENHEENYTESKQKDQELYPEVKVAEVLPDEQVHDDLATKIVREIQKSTTELNIKSQSMPKLNSNKTNNRAAISSVFNGGGLRMSMKKSKKKGEKEDEPVSSSGNEDTEKN